MASGLLNHTRRWGAAIPFALVVAGILAIGTAACIELPGSAAAPQPTPTDARPIARPTAVVKRGSIVESIKLIGRVAAVDEAQLYFADGGRLRDLAVKPGQEVKAGDLIAELDTGDLDAQIKTAEANLDLARLKLAQEQAKQGDPAKRRELELEQARLAINKAEADLAKAEADLAKAKAGQTDVEKAEAAVKASELALETARQNLTITLKSETVAKDVRDRESEKNWFEVRYGETLQKYNAGQATKADLDRDWANLIAAKERYESAIAASDKAVTQAKQAVLDAEQKLKEDQAELARVRALPPDAYLQSYEVAITQARLALDQANADYAGKLATGGANTELDLLVRQVEQAQVDLDKLLAKQEASRLVAPFDGRVTAAQGRPGDQISAYQTIAIVSDPGTLAVKAELLDTDLARVAVGQKVQLTIDTMPGEALTGEISRVPSGLTNADGQPDHTIDISVDWPRQPDLGSLARATVLIRQKDGVLIVPAKAVRTVGKRQFVEYYDGELRRGANVEVGIVTETEAEIISGLSEGQVILVGQ